MSILSVKVNSTKQTDNKAFKADSQRMAFSVCLEFSVYGTMV
ncbi:hypothetical protein D029_2493 [Vibrio parahaemolyticus 970107]|nr:hypothetical protein D029_2493 [Vibrio parahaemolyticus 970107]